MAAMHHIVAMDTMPGMSGSDAAPAPSAAPSTSPQPPQAAAADAMVQSMNDMHMAHGGHMQMTMRRPVNAADQQHAGQIVATLRKAIEPYKDYLAA